MPEYTRGKQRDQDVAVLLFKGVYYQFKTKDLSKVPGVGEGDLAVLKHVKIGNDGGGIPKSSIVFLRANAPKPPRVSKQLSKEPTVQGSISTFCAPDALSASLRAGWNLVKPGRAAGAQIGPKSVTAIAKLSNGVLYGFSLNKRDFETYKTPLGLEGPESLTTDAERQKLVIGSSLPKPGKAKLKLENGSDFSTFCSHDAPLGGGFKRITEERLI
jgi:hypothetical protein